MRFFKAHACGNDYVICFSDGNYIQSPNELAGKLCKRRFSVGADGFIFLSPSVAADIIFRIFNPDGSESEMCGNGIRCAALCLSYFGSYYGINSRKKSDFSVFSFETAVGFRQVKISHDRQIISAEMGQAEVGEAFDFTSCDGSIYHVTPVNIGNPHAVIFTESEVGLCKIMGAASEIGGAFKNGANVHAVMPIGDGRLMMRTHERGVGETLSCGTGGCAVYAAAESLGAVVGDAVIRQDGGEIEVGHGKGGLILSGKAEIVGEVTPLCVGQIGI